MLHKQVVLALIQMGLVGYDQSGRQSFPGDGTVEAVWTAYVAWLGEPEREIDDRYFKSYRRLKRRLKSSTRPHPDVILRAIVRLLGPGPISSRQIEELVGKEQIADTNARVSSMAGVGRKPPAFISHGTIGELLSVLPAFARSRFRTALKAPKYPAIVMPPDFVIGRVLRLPDGPIRLRSAVVVIRRAVEGIVSGRRGLVMVSAERHIAVMDGVSSTDRGLVTQRLDLYRAGTLLPTDLPGPRLDALREWDVLGREAEAFTRVVLGDDADKLIDHLPARHWRDQDFAAEVRASLKTVRGLPAADRLLNGASLVTARTDMLIASENRVRLVEALLMAATDKIKKAADQIANGDSVGFSWTGPVLRPNGSLGPTKQTIHFRIEREVDLLKRLHVLRPDNDRITVRMPRTGSGPNAGKFHRPGRDDRLHLIYDRTEPEEPSGEFHEPFFVEIYRWRLFGSATFLTPDFGQLRRRRMDELALKPCVEVRSGLIGPLDRSDAVITALAHGGDPVGGDFIIPLVSLLHGLSFARLALQYGIRWGARIGEILQIRLGPTCFRKHKIYGRWKPYLALRPKGWTEDGKFGLDKQISDMMRRLKALTSARCYPGLVDENDAATLPVIPLRATQRCLEDARFLFQAFGLALRSAAIGRLCSLLMIGVVDMRTHDGRYAFATALGLGGTGYEEIGELMHHAKGSPMSRAYDLSGLILADEAAERFHDGISGTLSGVSLG